MVNHMRVVNATGAAAVGTTLAPGESFRLREVRIKLSAAGGAGNLTITVDAGAGAAYDVNLLTQDMTLITSFSWTPDTQLQFSATDEIDFVWANANSRTYGLTIYYELL